MKLALVAVCFVASTISVAGQVEKGPRVTGGTACPMENGCWKIVCEPGARQLNVMFGPLAFGQCAEAVVLDFYSADIAHFSGFFQRVFDEKQSGFERFQLSPMKSCEWTQLTLKRGMGTSVHGGIADWSRLGGVKFTVEIAAPEACAVVYLGRPRAVVKPHLRPARAGERRLGWVTAHAMGDDDWEAAAAFLAKYGFTDMVALAARGTCAYYESAILPRAAGWPIGKDVAREAVSACRRHGLKCHLWKTSWQARDTPADFLVQLEAEGRFQVTDEGKVDRGWTCPSDPRNRAIEFDIMKEFVELGAEAVHFDYNRYAGETHCFCSRCLKAFSAKVGRSVTTAEIRNDNVLSKAWADWRAELISSLVRDVAEYAHARTPRVEVSGALYRNPPLDYVPHAQDWPRWCREGWLDLACPMDYYWSPEVYRGFLLRQKREIQGTRTLFCPGIGLSCNAWARMPEENFLWELDCVRELGCDGFTVFSIGDVAKDYFPHAFVK